MIGIKFQDLGKRKFYFIKEIVNSSNFPKTVKYDVSLYGTNLMCSIEVCRITETAWVNFDGARLRGKIIKNKFLAQILNFMYGV